MASTTDTLRDLWRRLTSRVTSTSAFGDPSTADEPGPASYQPERDGLPDPGEVVWAWVPFEDDPSQGKDRPVLLLAPVDQSAEALWGLMMSSQDHDLDAEDEASYGRYWWDVGSGGWDPSGRPSEVRLDRLLRVSASEVRREGAALDRALFDEVVAQARRFHPDL